MLSGVLEFLGRTMASVCLGSAVAFTCSFILKRAEFHQAKLAAHEVLSCGKEQGDWKRKEKGE